MNARLVIGNGFDLAIGARTSYHSFFESDDYFKTKKEVFHWIELWSKQSRIPPGINLTQFDFNCWDLLFCLMSKERSDDSKGIRWCDIEKEIYASLTNTELDSFSWEIAREILNNIAHNRKYQAGDPPYGRLLSLENSNKNTRNVAEYISQLPEWRKCCEDRSAFYEKLLDELKRFEESFGSYIKRQTSDEEYRNNSWRLVKRMLGSESNIQIDSFNYSDFSTGMIQIRHVNGDFDNPIFGINLSPEEEEKRPELRRFTKTSRRLHQDSENLNRNTKWELIPIDYSVVFGHSLNQMDYDFFHYLFTMLQFHTFDLDKMGKIQFVYKIYDSKRSKDIRSRYADSIFELMNYYESNVSRVNNHILINLLRFSGKLMICELV